MIDVPSGKVNFLARPSLRDSCSVTRNVGPCLLEVDAGDRGGTAMVAAFDSRTVEDDAVGGVLGEDLAFQDSPVFEREMEDVAERSLRHGIKPYDRCRSVQAFEDVPDAPEVAMTTV
jgi:hypothetical protein